jgi:hypothetical protein
MAHYGNEIEVVSAQRFSLVRQVFGRAKFVQSFKQITFKISPRHPPRIRQEVPGALSLGQNQTGFRWHMACS